MFQPEKASPILLSLVQKALMDAGLDPHHIAICYDGMEDEETYSICQNFYPAGDEQGHSYILARALRSCQDFSDPNVNGMLVRFFDDGTLLVAPAVVGVDPTAAEDIEEDEDA